MVKITTGLIVTNIYRIAEERKITIKDIEQGAGISVGYLSRIKLGGDVKMSVDMLLRISEYLKMSVDDIIKYSMRKDILIPAEVKSFICEVEDDTKNNKLYWHVTQTDVYNDEMVKKLGCQVENIIKLYSYSTVLLGNAHLYLYKLRYCHTKEKLVTGVLGYELYVQNEKGTFPVMIAVQGYNEGVLDMFIELEKSVIANLEKFDIANDAKDILFNYKLARKDLK